MSSWTEGTVGEVWWEKAEGGGGEEDDDEEEGDDSSDNEDYLNLFITLIYGGSIVVIGCLVIAIVYFIRKSGTQSDIMQLVGYYRGDPASTGLVNSL